MARPAAHQDRPNPNTMSTAHSPWKLLARLLIIIAACEAMVMLILDALPTLPPWQEALLDATMLACFAFPFLWVIVRKTAVEIGSAERDKLAARTAAILSSAVDGIVVTDARGCILLFNKGAERIFGYTEAEIKGQRVSMLIPERLAGGHDRHVSSFAKGSETARSMHDRSVLHGRHKDGTEIPVEVSLAKSATADEVTMVAVVRDVSDRYRIEAELRHAKEQAEAGARAKSEFLANMSHEIRTPLNAVIGLTDLLLTPGLTPVQRDYLETIRTSGDSLMTIINDILDYSKIEAGQMELEMLLFDFRTCVDSALDLMAAGVGRKPVDLLAQVEDEVPQAFHGDAGRLRQILVNLVGNALKFTDRGEVFVHAHLVTRNGNTAEVQVDVKDTGIGIPPERLDRLFKSFSQVDSSTTRRYGGTGLGLAISRRLVERMGGQLWVESTQGVGTTFSFRLPLLVSLDPPPPAPDAMRLKGRRILVVDDNATNRHILSCWLEKWGATPLVFTSGADALAALQEDVSLDAALLDLHMPEMDGAVLAVHLRSRPETARLPLVLLSSSGPHLPAEQRRHFNITLGKPTKPLQLLQALREALGHAATPTAGAVDEQDEPAPVSQVRILVADDSEVNRKVVAGMLQRLGYLATLANDGQQALATLQGREFDVILMDVQMPVMDGLEATRRIRETEIGGSRRLYVVALTANVLESDRAECRQAGMDDFLGKPFRLPDLRRVLMRAEQHLGLSAGEASAASLSSD